MVRGSGRVTLALLLAFFTRTVPAFWDPPYIVPDSPSINDIVSLNIRMGACDALLSHPGYPEITRVGNAIRYVQWGDHSLLSELCIYPTGTGTFGLGTFAPGTYSVSFDMIGCLAAHCVSCRITSAPKTAQAGNAGNIG